MPERIYLGIDTATPFLALALWSPGQGVLAGFEERLGRDHAERLLGELENLLGKAGVSKRQLAGVGVGLGPGSYTGLRVGVAAARGLARGLGVPLGGGGTLQAVAAKTLAAGETGVCALDARRGNVYGGVFRRQGEDVTTLVSAGKWERAALRASQPDLPYFEDAAPDAGYLAKLIFTGAARAVEPVYL